MPKGLNRDEVLRLLATTEGDRPADLRDRAILMVLLTHGLRGGEVPPACGSMIQTGRRRHYGCAAPSPGARISIRSRAASDRQSCVISEVDSGKPDRQWETPGLVSALGRWGHCTSTPPVPLRSLDPQLLHLGLTSGIVQPRGLNGQRQYW